MKIVSSLDRPRFCKFDQLGDKYSGTIVLDPQWVADPLDPSREVWKIVFHDDRGVYLQLNARTQMPNAIEDAVFAAGTDEIEVGGELEIEWVETRGNTKVYRATYTPPPEGGFR